MTPAPILVQAEQVRQPTYRFRYAIAPQPPQTSLSAKCRTLTARAVLAPLVSDKNRSDVTTITLGPGHKRPAPPRAVPPQPVRPRAVRPRAGLPRAGRPGPAGRAPPEEYRPRRARRP